MKGLLTNKASVVDCPPVLLSYRVENGSSIRVHTKEHAVFITPNNLVSMKEPWVDESSCGN